MKLAFTKKSLLVVVIGIILVTVLNVGGYYLLLVPKQQAMSQAETQLETEKKMLTILQEKNDTDEEEKQQIEHTTELQRKLPVDPLLDQLILDFQRVEALSGTYILDITFQHDLSFSNGKKEETEAPVEKQEENSDAKEEEGIKQITANFTIRAVTYEDLYALLEEIDKLPRIVSIE